MRRIALLIAAACLASPVLCTPVQAASRQAHDDCNAADDARNIAGCTLVLEDATEPATVRAIAHVGRGFAYQNQRKFDRALDDFTAAIALNPNDALAYGNRGVLWRFLNEADKAIADFTAAIDIAPLPRSDVPGVPHVNMYDNRGLAYHAKGDFERALADFDAAIELDREAPMIYYHRSQTLIARKEFGRASDDLDAVIRLDKNPPPVIYAQRGALRYQLYTGDSPYIRSADLLGAIADFSAALKADPNDIGTLHARAVAYRMNGETDKAVADLIAAVTVNPMYDEAVALLKQLKPDWQKPRPNMLKYLQGETGEK